MGCQVRVPREEEERERAISRQRGQLVRSVRSFLCCQGGLAKDRGDRTCFFLVGASHAEGAITR